MCKENFKLCLKNKKKHKCEKKMWIIEIILTLLFFLFSYF